MITAIKSRINNGREIRRLKAQWEFADEVYNQARERCQNAIEQRRYQIQHDAARDVHTALHNRMRIEQRIRELAS